MAHNGCYSHELVGSDAKDSFKGDSDQEENEVKSLEVLGPCKLRWLHMSKNSNIHEKHK